MMLTVGAKVVYPSRGPCLIGEVVKKVVGGQTMKFYPLALLDDSKGELFVPVENIADSHLRALLDRSEIPQLLRRLEKISENDERSLTPPRIGVSAIPTTQKLLKLRFGVRSGADHRIIDQLDRD